MAEVREVKDPFTGQTVEINDFSGRPLEDVMTNKEEIKEIVEDGCGCPSCDIGLEPFEAHGAMWHASEKHGAWPCTKTV